MEAGFTRQATAAHKRLHATAMAGGIHAEKLGSVKEARSFASNQLSEINSFLRTINREGDGNATVGGAFTGGHAETGDKEFDRFMKWFDARAQDRLEGARLLMPVHTQYLEKSLEIDRPMIEEVDGELQLGQFDISFEGKLLARSMGGGAIAQYRDNGTLDAGQDRLGGPSATTIRRPEENHALGGGALPGSLAVPGATGDELFPLPKAILSVRLHPIALRVVSHDDVAIAPRLVPRCARRSASPPARHDRQPLIRPARRLGCSAA